MDVIMFMHSPFYEMSAKLSEAGDFTIRDGRPRRPALHRDSGLAYFRRLFLRRVFLV
jgi:hypothetical protein